MGAWQAAEGGKKITLSLTLRSSDQVESQWSSSNYVAGGGNAAGGDKAAGGVWKYVREGWQKASTPRIKVCGQYFLPSGLSLNSRTLLRVQFWLSVVSILALLALFSYVVVLPLESSMSGAEIALLLWFIILLAEEIVQVRRMQWSGSRAELH